MSSTLIVVIGALLGVAYWYWFWKGHAAKFEQSGYVPPATSRFGQNCFATFAYLLTFLTVGRVKVIGGKNAPKTGRVIFAANHQLPCDFAMVRRASGRHFRMLTASDQLKGFFGALAAVGGVISVAFKNKDDGQKAEKACVYAVGRPHHYQEDEIDFDWSLAIVGIFFLVMPLGWALFEHWGALAFFFGAMALLMFGTPVGEPALGIFPQGSLLPDDEELKELFRPGAVRIATAAKEMAREEVVIVPMAIHYKWEAPARLSFLDRKLAGMRSMFLGTRNPKVWNPIFKQKIDHLPTAEREAIEAERKEIMRAHYKSKVTNYGGVVVVGDPIKSSELPADSIEAIAIIRGRIAELHAEAKRH